MDLIDKIDDSRYKRISRLLQSLNMNYYKQNKYDGLPEINTMIEMCKIYNKYYNTKSKEKSEFKLGDYVKCESTTGEVFFGVIVKIFNNELGQNYKIYYCKKTHGSANKLLKGGYLDVPTDK